MKTFLLRIAMSKAIIPLTLLACGIVAQRAEAVDYILSSSGNWATAGNWTPSGVPSSSSDNATIENSLTANVTTGVSGTAKNLYVGNNGIGTLNITGGNVTTTSGSSIGNSAGSNGTVNISSGSWSNSGILNVGYSGTGTLNISGGNITNTHGLIGGLLGSCGTVNISNGLWLNTSDLYVAYNDTCTGTLNISGGNISNTNGYIGFWGGSNGTVNMNSGSWTNNGTLTVGKSGSGTLNITGGSATNTDGYIGSGHNGTVNISNGSWTNSGNLSIGYYGGTGTLNITGGSVSVGGGAGYVMLVEESAGAGSWGTGAVSGGTGTLNIGTGGAATGNLLASTVTGGNGTAIVNFNHTGNTTFAPLLAGSLSVNKLGTGTTTLTGANSYNGTTIISAGVLIIGGNQASATGNLTVENGATLAGTGTIGGVTIINGVVAPGDLGTIGTLSIAKDVTWNGAASASSATDLKFDLGAGTSSDRLSITGNLTKGVSLGTVFRFDFGGTGSVQNTGEYYTLMNWSIGSTFSASNFTYTNLNAAVNGTFSIASNQLRFTTTAVPEPSTWALLSRSRRVNPLETPPQA